MNEKSNRTVTSSELADILGIRSQQINRLKRAGVFSPVQTVGRSRFPLLESVKNYVKFRTDHAGKVRGTVNDELNQSRLRRVRSRVELARQKLVKLDSEVYEATDLEEHVIILNRIISDCLLSFPAETAIQLVGIKLIPDAVDILERNIFALLNKIRESIHRELLEDESE